jgi:hypothetical protein
VRGHRHLGTHGQRHLREPGAVDLHDPGLHDSPGPPVQPRPGLLQRRRRQAAELLVGTEPPDPCASEHGLARHARIEPAVAAHESLSTTATERSGTEPQMSFAPAPAPMITMSAASIPGLLDGGQRGRSLRSWWERRRGARPRSGFGEGGQEALLGGRVHVVQSRTAWIECLSTPRSSRHRPARPSMATTWAAWRRSCPGWRSRGGYPWPVRGNDAASFRCRCRALRWRPG